jgi:carbonic anhydrase/acetyltransferase-like protein (isoleucine patch superfamily)
MLRPNPWGDLPVVHESAFVDPTAILCGKIIVEENVFIGPYAVIRADERTEQGDMKPIIIGAESNIQDGVVIHSKSGAEVTIGRRVSVAHRAIVHGPCRLGEGCFVGFNAVLYNCSVGEGSVVRHNSVVENCNIPAGFHIPSSTVVHGDTDLTQIPRISADEQTFSESVVKANNEFVKGYNRIRNLF